MALTQLVYVSRRPITLDRRVLEDIVARSARFNASRGITGILLCCGQHFIQLLEGELAEVMELFERIRCDERHTDVRCLLVKNVARRLFPEWGMGLADLDAQGVLNTDRLRRLLDDVRAAHDTGPFSLEARLLLNDFRAQLHLPAA